MLLDIQRNLLKTRPQMVGTRESSLYRAVDKYRNREMPLDIKDAFQ